MLFRSSLSPVPMEVSKIPARLLPHGPTAILLLNHHTITGIYNTLRHKNAIIYSSFPFPPTDFQKGLSLLWRQHRLTVCNCWHDEPKIALSSSSRLGNVGVPSLWPRATRIDARAMVDGWYSTELIAADRHEKRMSFFLKRNVIRWNRSRGRGDDL